MLAQESHESGDRGWIVNISSIYGLVGGGDNRKFLLATFWLCSRFAGSGLRC